jgi:phenylalanyl-tRNA synthetase beta chain
MGLQEVITHSLVGSAPYGTEADDAHRAKLSAPMSPEFSTLRLSLLPAHFTIAAEALRSGQRDMAFFEVGAIYRKDGDTFSEPFRVSGLAAGSAMPAAWSLKMDALPADFYYAKGIVEQLCQSLGLTPTFAATNAHPLAHPYRTASVLVDNTPIGTVGELSEKTITDCDLPKRSVFFDLDGDALMRLSEKALSRYRTIANRPSAVRDLAPVLAKSVAYGTVETAAQAALSPLCESFRLVDVYEGANVGEGNRSLTLRLTFRAPDRTLTNEEVDTELARVREAIEAVGGVFRG